MCRPSSMNRSGRGLPSAPSISEKTSMNFSRGSVSQYAAISLFALRTPSTWCQRAGFGAIEMNAMTVPGDDDQTLAANALKSAATVWGVLPWSTSLAPAYMKISADLWGARVRSAKYVESAMYEPPNPRFTTRCCGKSLASVSHMRMLELPMKTIRGVGERSVRSVSSKALMSDSKAAACGAGAPAAVPASAATAGEGRAGAAVNEIAIRTGYPRPRIELRHVTPAIHRRHDGCRGAD